MLEKEINYFNSLCVEQTRTQGVNGMKLRSSIMIVVLEYLKEKHIEIKGSALPDAENWKFNESCQAPQQTNRIDCEVFICMDTNFIHDNCRLGFDLSDITIGTLKDGYVRKVPLPRVPQEQRASPELTAPKDRIQLPGYSILPEWIPTLPKLGSILGFSQRLL